MKTFKRFLIEALDSKPAPITKKKFNPNGTSTYEFTIDGNKYFVNFYGNSDGFVSVDFSLVNQKTGEQDLGFTNTGNAYKVLITVITCIKNHINQLNVFSTLTFSADKDRDKNGSFTGSSRAKLYARLVKKYFPPSEYEVEIEDANLEVVYMISPKKKQKQKKSILSRIFNK
jgi:hypothetical protein